MKALIIDSGAVSRLSRVGHRAAALLDLYAEDESIVPIVPSVVCSQARC